MNTLYKISIKLIIAALLLGCLAKMPYGYYQFTKIAACLGFILLSTDKDNRENGIIVILVIGIILFQPIWKIHFTRQVWNIIDVIIAGGLIIWILIDIVFKKKIV